MIEFKQNFWRGTIWILIVFGLVFSFQNIQSFSPSNNQVNTIVLDAGHGGKDPGAIGAISNEKDITLQVVLKLGQLLHKKYPLKKIVYTRTTDIYPSLVERHNLANAEKGDLFVSIHVNSTSGTSYKVKTGTRRVKQRNGKYTTVAVYKTVRDRTTTRSGTESYVLGLHRNDQKEDAIADNSEIINDENGMLNPDSPMTNIIVAQYAQAYLNKSITLGSLIEEQFAKQGRRSDGVKQKGLEVLAGSAMPGVLVEIGFINNPQEEVYLTSESGQWETAEAVMNGIVNYITAQENKTNK